MSGHRVHWIALAAGMLLVFALSACAGSSTPEPTEAPTEAPTEEPTAGPRDYNVPSEDAAMANPITYDEASVQRGKEIYEASCIKCHGETGRADGTSAPRLNPPPVDFRAEHVVALSDGELFYIITNSVEGTAMLPFGYLDEDQRWHLVNYVRNLQE